MTCVLKLKWKTKGGQDELNFRPESSVFFADISGSINKEFGSFANLTNQFKGQATKQFGSGWVWLVVDRYGKLQVTTTDNQDNPLMKNALIPGTPIMGIDLWEHAYYLDYQNRKGSYIDAFYEHVNWEKVNENYIEALKKVKKVY